MGKRIKQLINKLEKQIVGAWLSFTIWFNTIGAVILYGALSDPLMLKYLTENGFVWVIIVGNIILRFKTNSDLADKTNGLD